MNLNYAIFRSEPIYTINDLAGIGSHNKREKTFYNSNPDIKINLSKNNIELVPLADKYVKGFYNKTKEYRKEHEERMKNTREDRQKTFRQMLDKSKSVVADELLFTATHKFFENMTREDIKEWADTCMEFVYNDLGYSKEQVLYSVVHLDEETPHIHCTVIPLIRKYDKRTKTERYTISKKAYIKDKIHLSGLQDLYHKRLTEKGYDLERGIKGTGIKNIKTKELKKITKYYEKKVNVVNEKLDTAISEFEKKAETTKNVPFDKKHIIIEKETFDSMSKVIKETKKAIEIQPQIEQLFVEIDTFTKSHQTLEKENRNMQREIKSLTTRNQNLTQERNHLKSYIKTILKAIKQFFRHLLLIGNEPTKQATTNEIKEYYSNNDFDYKDIYEIARDTTKEKELFEYADIEYSHIKNIENDIDKDFTL